jgi:hypothetical protein
LTPLLSHVWGGLRTPQKPSPAFRRASRKRAGLLHY